MWELALRGRFIEPEKECHDRVSINDTLAGCKIRRYYQASYCRKPVHPCKSDNFRLFAKYVLSLLTIVIYFFSKFRSEFANAWSQTMSKAAHVEFVISCGRAN